MGFVTLLNRNCAHDPLDPLLGVYGGRGFGLLGTSPGAVRRARAAASAPPETRQTLVTSVRTFQYFLLRWASPSFRRFA